MKILLIGSLVLNLVQAVILLVLFLAHKANVEEKMALERKLHAG